MSNLDFEDANDEEISEKHSELIDAVKDLDKRQRVKKTERNEPSLAISEFHLVKSGVTDKDAIQVSDLVKTLGRKGYQTEITKQFNVLKNKSKVLAKPLEKPVADRIKRTVGFEKTKKELQKWNSVVAQNRTAESISFPLYQPSMRLETTSEFVNRFRIKSDLEKELDALEPPKINIDEEVDELELSLGEILQRRAEAAKLRAQQSYKVAKARRQNKIKSKKFHRIQRKEKMKQQLKEFEELQKIDPHAALEKLKHLEKIRAEERMTLRHKSTGHWARNKLIRAKYDKESRQELAQQLSISRDLTKKIQSFEDSEEELEEEKSAPIPDDLKDNPWINKVKTESEIDQFLKDYRTFTENQKKKNDNNIEVIETKENVPKNNKVTDENNRKKKREILSDKNQHEVFDVEEKCQVTSIKGKKKSKKEKVIGTSNWTMTSLDSEEKSTKKLNKVNIDEMFDSMDDKIKNKVNKQIKNLKNNLNITVEKIQNEDDNENNLEDDDFDKLQWKKSNRKSIDQSLDETTERINVQNKDLRIKNTTKIQETEISTPEKSKEMRIDPNSFKEVKIKHFKTQMPDADIAECEALDDDNEETDRYELMNEAFSDEDVVEEFKKDKENEVKKTEPEDVDLSLPGWGSWGGKNIKESSRKKNRFILKFPKDAPRRDENKGNVIIIEENNPTINKHQVTELPFPFNSVKDYEASMRAPIGRNFVPEKTYRRLIKPAVSTKIGKVIEPMDEDSLVSIGKLKKRSKIVDDKKILKKIKI